MLSHGLTKGTRSSNPSRSSGESGELPYCAVGSFRSRTPSSLGWNGQSKWGLQTVPLLGCTFKRAAFVGRDMIGLVALDFVLRIVFRSVMHMTLVVEIRGVDGDDGPRHPACFRIPAYIFENIEGFDMSVVTNLAGNRRLI